MNALGGIPATIDPMVQTAAKVLALSALRILEDKPSRDAAMAEFVSRTGGGIGGTNWTAPLCDYPAPIHFRWPEYVTTPRGQDWWIPSAMPDA
jgi:aminobenzoyl-glutamate utilization protein B